MYYRCIAVHNSPYIDIGAVLCNFDEKRNSSWMDDKMLLIFCHSFIFHSLPNHPDVIIIQSTNENGIPNTFFYPFLLTFCLPEESLCFFEALQWEREREEKIGKPILLQLEINANAIGQFMEFCSYFHNLRTSPLD